MRVYCKCKKIMTAMKMINWEIDEDLDSISYTYKCLCGNVTKIYLNNVGDIIKNGVEKL